VTGIHNSREPLENSREAQVTGWRDEALFRRDFPILWWLTLLGPFALTGAILLVVLESAGANIVWRLISTAFATFFFFGKFVILGGSDRKCRRIDFRPASGDEPT